MPDGQARPTMEAAFARALSTTALSDEETRFLSQAAADWSPGELKAWGEADLAAEAAALWRWANEAEGPGPHIRVRRTGRAGPPVDLIEVVQDDAPFLVASVMGEIGAQGLSVLAMIHPLATIDDRRRSLIQVAVEPPKSPKAVVEALTQTLADVRAAVDDFPEMTALMAELSNEVETSGRATQEELAFLSWLNGGRFVFLGARLYDYPLREGAYDEGAPLVLPRQGLGVLRDPDRLVLRQSHEPAVLSPLLRQRIERGSALTVAKSNLKSRVHRRAHMDYVELQRYGADGRPVGEARFVGLFTAEAYSLPVSQTPLIRTKAAAVFDRAGLPPQGHSAARLRNILETWPRDDLFQISEDELLEGALHALHLQDRPRVDLFVRRDPFDRFASILLYVPRDRYDFSIIDRAGKVLAEAFNGRVSAAYPESGDAPLARIHFIVGFTPGHGAQPDLAELRQRLADLTHTFADRLEDVVRRTREPAEANQILAYADAFPPGYRDLNSVEDAVADVEVLQSLGRGESVAVRMFRRRGDVGHRFRFKLYARKTAPALADVVPILEHLDLKAVREDGFEVTPHAGSRAHVQEYLIEDRARDRLDLAQAAPVFEEAFVAIWNGLTESDGFNRLVLELGVSWREAALIRALAKHRQQSGLDPSQLVQEQALANHPQIAALILELFSARFDPALGLETSERARRSDEIFARIETALQAVQSLDDDRALRRLALLAKACVRTNFYQPAPDGRPKPYISFKVASRELADLPSPKPFREIFVSACNVEGVHLRFGPVARGGLRWSDRRDDFRTEVLGLVKAQQVKNAVIVPVGSKGGFFPKRLPRGGSSEDVRKEAVEAYRTFLCGLLDITDNLDPGGEVVRPPQVVAHDADDPYLVVAADKGTASFSDIANGIAGEYGFWLGDAFASGGSAGYDHKAMGITARGAWEAVKRHFREMGKDIQSEPFTVVGVGDMSGDVFGNGMLLSKAIKLVAAFDHRHVFIDPDPDPAASWAERARLFALPRSSWDDYDRNLISRGGGVFPRSAKSIPLTPQMQSLLDVKAQALPPAELISAILKARVELLYLGGIGAYVKAQAETHAQVGDKANDALRVDAADLRCKVVGEGANLGVTQAGRIEFARLGGRINTDAIDNSAGVDTSDHEVNIKILTGLAERGGKLTRQARDTLLESMTDEVADLVLADNYDQTLALSLLEAEAQTELSAHARFITALETSGRLDRKVEGLPAQQKLDELARAGQGLTRPELAVLLAYGKLDLFDQIIRSEAPDDVHFFDTLRRYFPGGLGRFEDEMRRHPLRREIIATVIGNEIINRCGPTFPARLRAAAGCDTASLVIAFQAARRVLDLDDLWSQVEALDGKAPAAGQVALFRELAYLQRGQTYWLARRLAAGKIGVGALAFRYAPPGAELRGQGVEILSPFERKEAARRAEGFIKAGAPEDLARQIGALRPLTTAADLVDLCESAAWPLTAMARLYHQVGGRIGFDRLRAAAGSLGSEDAFERTAVRRLIEEMLAEQTTLTAKVARFAASPQAGESEKAAGAAIASWSALHREAVTKTKATFDRIEAAGGGWTFAKLTIANSALRELSAVS